ncbi:Phage portal protein [Pirellula sp. SH-Sr6A]|uniref:phage portal protein n=1 Tax=Pirellula sp. SH-Sr6A TaxID=1632865 RepID=UPI00078CE0E4|nr:phage portal protein [Pirellula sp. SH-Sr6A]AMV35676.1 Phage portal protein [Pirellula sp. SH-Sr6A]
MHGPANLYEILDEVLSMYRLGDVASDHRAELEGFRGWNYVAITSVARQATRALVYVYDDSKDPLARTQRKALRMEFGARWREESVRKGLVREHQGTVADSTHPLMRLLNRPHPRQSGGAFRWEQMVQLRLHGCCLVFNRPNVLKTRTVERYVIPMAMVTPIRPGRYQSMPRGGVIIRPQSWTTYSASYDEESFSAIRQFVGVELPAEMLTVIKYPHPFLKGDGASPTNAAAPWIDASNALDDCRDKFYREGPNGKLLLTSDEDDPEKLSEVEDNLSRRLSDDGAAVTFVGKATSVVHKRTADEMQFVEGHDQLRDCVLAAHGVSRSSLGIQDGMTYSSLAASLLGTSMLSIQPDMDLIADEDTITLGREYGEHVSIELEVPAVNDPELEDRRLEADSKIGVMTVGEYRTKRGEPTFGNELDGFILTANGPVDPRTLIKASGAASGFIPPVDKAIRIGHRKLKHVIDVDPTLLEEISPQVTDIFESSGFRLRPLDDDNEESGSSGLWDWSYGTDAVAFVKSIPSLSGRDELESKLLEVGRAHKYACVMLKLPEAIEDAVLREAACLNDADLSVGGREDEPHVTALYGITGASVDEIARVVSRLESPLVSFRGVTSFPGGDRGVPLIVAVESPALHAINRKLRDSLPHVLTHPKYNPHVTIAYVNDSSAMDGACSSITGRSCYLTKAIISMEDGTKAVVPLRRPSMQEGAPAVTDELRSVISGNSPSSTI